MNIAKYIDHTLLKPTAGRKDIASLCDEAEKYGFACVCINPCYVEQAKKILKDSGVKICSVISFPLGADLTESKVFQARKCVEKGVGELDMVINIGKLLSKDFDFVLRDIKSVKNAVGDKILKVIIETAYLSDELIITACNLAKRAGADFVKTSTGFAPSGAKAKDIGLMRKTVGENMGVKASGGIKTYRDAFEMIKAGANRIGTSSSVKIVNEN